MPAPDYLTSIFAPYTSPAPHPTRPFVTLTFAQSLDGKIGGAGGTPLALSGPDSMVMTHWLRTLHDAILVGSGTALGDDPQLNTRHLPPPPPGAPPHRAPCPIVLDSGLRLPTTCKLLRNYDNGKGTGRQPWVVGVAPGTKDDSDDVVGWKARRAALEGAGARVLVLELDHDASRTPALLALLHEQGIRTLMVEGGARVIASFLAAPRAVDTLLITTAPVLVGATGVGWGVEGVVDAFRVVETLLVGRDSIVAFVASGDTTSGPST
ncbi:dihydrofolate reductase-like domain-containing protein [Mycena galericulata]|nr:dihydrofolate reductase-like domain-containing protein [Mycena galericulata]